MNIILRPRKMNCIADDLEVVVVFFETDFFKGVSETVLFASEEGPGKS